MNAGPYYHYQYLNGNYAISLLFAHVSSADDEEIILCLRNKPGNINTFVAHATWHRPSCQSQEQQRLLPALRATF